MASRHYSVKRGSVGKGVAHARYVAGQGPYADRTDVVMTLDKNLPSWAKDAEAFFAAADKFERANGRAYTEIEFAIPRGVKDPEFYASYYAKKLLGDRHPYRLAVHDKVASDGGRNIHAHLMFSERVMDGIERDQEHFFKRAAAAYRDRKTKELHQVDPAKGGAAKDRTWNDRGKVQELRGGYSAYAKQHGIDLDLRSNKAQGLGDPEPKVGPDHPRADQNPNRQTRADQVAEMRQGRKRSRAEGARKAAEASRRADLLAVDAWVIENPKKAKIASMGGIVGRVMPDDIRAAVERLGGFADAERSALRVEEDTRKKQEEQTKKKAVIRAVVDEAFEVRDSHEKAKEVKVATKQEHELARQASEQRKANPSYRPDQVTLKAVDQVLIEQAKSRLDEKQRRIDALPELYRTSMHGNSAEAIWLRCAVSAEREASMKKEAVDWRNVDARAAIAAIRDEGHTKEATTQAILALSPGRADPTTHRGVHEWMDRNAGILERQREDAARPAPEKRPDPEVSKKERPQEPGHDRGDKKDFER